MHYETVIFLQGDDANEPIDALYNREGESVVYHGVTDESVSAAIEYLRQWDYGEPTEPQADTGAGTMDDEWREGEYVLTAHLGLGYLGLMRIVSDDECEVPAHYGHSRDSEPVVFGHPMTYWYRDGSPSDTRSEA